MVGDVFEKVDDKGEVVGVRAAFLSGVSAVESRYKRGSGSVTAAMDHAGRAEYVM